MSSFRRNGRTSILRGDVVLVTITQHGIQYVRRSHLAFVGNCRSSHQHLQRRDSHTLTKGVRAEIDRVPIAITRALEPARRLPRKVHARGMTETEAWAFQAPFVGKVFTSEDAKEGPRAFAEKRAPNWSGR